MRQLANRPRGAALLLALVLFLMLTAISLSILLLVNNHYVLANELLVRAKAYYLAEAGLQQAFWEARNGNTGSPPFPLSVIEDAMTATVTLSSPDGTGKRTAASTVSYTTVEDL